MDNKIVCLKRQWLLCIQFYSLNCVKSAILEIKGVDNIHWGLKAETLFCWFENVIGLKGGRMSGSWYCFHATKKYSIRLSDSWSRMTGIPNGKRLRYYHYNKGKRDQIQASDSFCVRQNSVPVRVCRAESLCLLSIMMQVPHLASDWWIPATRPSDWLRVCLLSIILQFSIWD